MRSPLNFFIVVSLALASCKKGNTNPLHNNTQEEEHENGKYGPYGKFSKWRSVAGDSIFSTDLTLSWYHLQKESPCNIHYYEMSYPLWNDYDQDFSISECAEVNDTLIIKDKDSNKHALFIKQK